jgi:tetratricopeptide (TPR) repeat protein
MNIRTDERLSAEIRDGRALLDLARGWLAQGNPVVAIELLKSATGSAQAEQDSELKACIFKETGRAMMMQSDWDSAEPYFLGAQRLFLESENPKGAAECARNRANMHFQQGNFETAQDLCEEALEWSAPLNDHQLRASILNTLAAIKSTTGDLREAIKTFKLCLADFQAADQLLRQGHVLLNIGLTQTELGEYSEAIMNLKEALAIAFREKDLQLVEICYQNIASCHLAQKETILARSVLRTARKILPGLQSAALETELDLIDCRILRALGDLEGSEALLRKTYIKAVEHNLIALQADILMEQGKLLADKGETQPAVCKLDAASHQYRQLGMNKGYREACAAAETLRRAEHVR